MLTAISCNFPTLTSLFQKAAALFAFLNHNVNSAPAYSDKSDEDLAVLLQNGDDQAFGVLYERYVRKIYAFIIRRVGVASIAEDLTSDVFMKAFAHRASFSRAVTVSLPYAVGKTGGWSAWIYRIAQNRVTDYYRTKKNDTVFDPDLHDREGQGRSVAEHIDNTILGTELESCLEKLNTRDRLAITLKFYNDADNTEIALALGVTPGNVAVIIHRALGRCAKAFGKVSREGEFQR